MTNNNNKNQKTYYDILEVSLEAAQDDIKKSYRRLSLLHHPDRANNKNNPSYDANLFKEINEAYETLGDVDKKALYDQMIRNSNNRTHRDAPQQQSPFATSSANDHDQLLRSIFEMMGMSASVHQGNPFFEHLQRRQQLNKPIPIMKTIQISLEQAFNGASIPVTIDRWIIESASTASSAESSSSSFNKRNEQVVIYVDIFPGIDSGEVIILEDQGNVNLAVKGDLKLFVEIDSAIPPSVPEYGYFTRQGLDLIFRKNISLKDALCGFTMEMKYLSGKVFQIHNAVGNIIHPGYRRVISGMGMRRGEFKGNLIIEFTIDFPTELSREQITGIQCFL